MSYTHFTIEERCCLREFYKKGYSYRKIAKLLGRNVSSVSRELRRNCTHMYDIPSYYPHTAQKKSNLRRSYCHTFPAIEPSNKIGVRAIAKGLPEIQDFPYQNRKCKAITVGDKVYGQFMD